VVSSHGAGQGVRNLRVAVTRPEVKASAAGVQGRDALELELQAAGAVPVRIPLVAIAGPDDGSVFQAAVAAWKGYDWLVFTSATAVRMFADAVADRGSLSGGLRHVGRPLVAAVGPATAAAVESELGLEIAAMPDTFTGAALADAMAAVAPLRDVAILWPRAQEARDALPRALEAAGARLDAPVAYRTVALPKAALELRRLVEAGKVDVITLTSPSAASCLAEAGPLRGTVVVAALGTSTARVAAEAGLPVHVVPVHHTIPGLVAALADYLSARVPE